MWSLSPDRKPGPQAVKLSPPLTDVPCTWQATFYYKLLGERSVVSPVRGCLVLAMVSSAVLAHYQYGARVMLMVGLGSG